MKCLDKKRWKILGRSEKQKGKNEVLAFEKTTSAIDTKARTRPSHPRSQTATMRKARPGQEV